MKKHSRLILASSSKQRKLMLESLGIPFEIIPADIDEKTIRDADLKKQAEKIARAKAEAIAAREQGVIIAADTFVELDGVALEKPQSSEEAFEMLLNQSAKQEIARTGFCYLDHNNDIDFSTSIEIKFRTRELSKEEIKAYVSTMPVMSWSAAFSPAFLYGMGMIAYVNGSLTGFTHGLPIEILVPLLRKSGFEVKP